MWVLLQSEGAVGVVGEVGISEKVAEVEGVEVKERRPTCWMGQVNGGLDKASR